MSSLLSSIPAPERSQAYVAPKPVVAAATATALVAVGAKVTIPPYGLRQGFIPRTIDHFGDGGAFPEVHIMQYPLDMGRKDKSAHSRVTALQVDASGEVQYDAVLRQGMDKSVVMYSKFTDLVEKNVEASALQRPDEDEQKRITDRTRAALEKKMEGRIKAAQPKTETAQSSGATYIRYTPGQAQQDDSHNSGAKQRIVRLQEMPNDPLEPPKFKHKRLPGGPPDAPVPIMHSPTRKMSVEEAANWKIPPCVSSWKNAKGFIIPLDKRLASDARGLQEASINDNFAKLSESLYVAEKKAREDIEARARIRQTATRMQQEMKEVEFRNLAAAARDRNSALDEREAEPEEEEAPMSAADIDERDRRDQMRADLKREREREARVDRAKKLKTGHGRDDDRDVSEAVALGKTLPKTQESMFDTRLYNQSQGMSAGLGGEDEYNVYSKPFSAGGSSTAALYRPTKSADADHAGADDMSSLLDTSKFKADRGFSGADSRAEFGGRTKPVEFEKATGGTDSFGIEQFLTEARARSNALDKIGSSGHMTASGGASSGDGLSSSSRSRINFTEGSSQR